MRPKEAAVDHPNAARYRALMAAFDAGDANALTAALAPDVRWHEAGNPDVIVGRDAVVARMSGMDNLDANIELHDVVANDEHCVAMLSVDLRKPDGAHVAYPVVEVVHVRDDVVTERWAFMDASPDDVTQFFADLL
jgi:ketosteroid isomerase-like protein